MESRRLAPIICVALCIVLLSVTFSEANQYFVGGSKEIGWNDKPKKESYNHWSKKTRFAVNDTIGKDTVLYVRQEDYKKCDNKNPVKTWDDGYTEVNLFRTGIYHFIGGNDGSCHNGQRLIVFVPEVQPPALPTPAAAPSPPPSQQQSPAAHTPAASPSTPPPAQQPPSPAAHTPAAAPSPLSPPVPSTPPPPQSPPPPPAANPTASGPSASAPEPTEFAPAPAPSSAWPVAARSILVPVIGVLFGVLFY